MFKSRALFTLIRKTSVRNINTTLLSKNAVTSSSATAEKLTIPVPEGVDKPINPKLENIVNQISGLNLLEVSELSSLLKKKLNLPDSAMMAVGYGAPSAAAPANEDEEEAAPKKVQTSFKVKLVKYDDKQKIALIKEIKNLFEGMNLVQAKKFVESIPTFVKEDVSKDEADKLKEALTKIGAVVEIE